jgi:hypothetical protein
MRTISLPFLGAAGLNRGFLPLAAALLTSPVVLAPAVGAAAIPYPDAVSRSRLAAQAVLDRAGAETCLRGKLTNALVGLSDSCAAAGRRNPLCSLADKAAVVTPMSLPFMDETAQRLLELTATPEPSVSSSSPSSSSSASSSSGPMP